MKITVLLVDDHQLVRKGFRRILEDDPDIQVVGEAGTGVDAIHMVEKFAPRVVVMDMAMPGLDGVQATRETAIAPRQRLGRSSSKRTLSLRRRRWPKRIVR